jgi:hypothetical protein
MDLDNLLRMDNQGLSEVVTKLVGGGVMSPNDGRYKHNLAPVKGGESPYLQQQNYSLEALAKRDKDDPFGKKQAPSPPPQPPEETDETPRMLWQLNSRNIGETIFDEI